MRSQRSGIITSLTHTCNNVNTTIHDTSGLELTSKLGRARNKARLQSNRVPHIGAFLQLTEAVKSKMI